MITLTINGRQALPLRSVPAVTNYFFSVRDIIGLLTDPESYYPTRLPAYHTKQIRLPLAQRMLPGGEIKAMLPAEHQGWIPITGDNPASVSCLPEDLFFWADEVQSLFEGMNAEIDARRLPWAPDAPWGTGNWNLAPYLVGNERALIAASLAQLQKAILGSNQGTKVTKRRKQFARDEDGKDPELQALAESTAKEWKTQGKRGNGVSKAAIAKYIANARNLDRKTVERVTRQTWTK